MPALRHAFVVSTSRTTSGSVTPSMTVRDVSPLKPWVRIPTSVLTRSPGMMTRLRDGMPWITSSFIDTQRCPGNPSYLWKLARTPCFSQ